MHETELLVLVMNDSPVHELDDAGVWNVGLKEHLRVQVRFALPRWGGVLFHNSLREWDGE